MENSIPPRDGAGGSAPSVQVPIIVGTSVMLTFISFWRAAAIILCDLGSSAFYVGGITERAIGRAAPWFVLAMLCFSYALRAVYIEASVMFVRGGVYQLVRTALGNTLAKSSVSVLVFNYALAGPISGVAGSYYLIGYLNEAFVAAGSGWHIPRGWAVTVLASLWTLLLWWRNTRGIQDSSDRALRVIQFTAAVMIALFLACAWTLSQRASSLPPSPTAANLSLSTDALGWLEGTRWIRTIGWLGLLLAFGHSILAIAGLETIAQVSREIAHPKVANLRRAGLVVFFFSLVVTSLLCFLPVMIIPDAERPRFFDNLAGGLAMSLDGPYAFRFVLHTLVAGAAILILNAAMNASIVGATGVLNRVSEDGLLFGWFREPHRRYGTPYRIINMVAVLQIAAIVMSRGDVYLLGTVYAFGVAWTFLLNTMSIYKLRRKRREHREWRVPFNIGEGRREVPLGILLVLGVLIAVALSNLLSMKAGTIGGAIFTLGMVMLFSASESRIQRRRAAAAPPDQFNLIQQASIDLETVGVRAAPILVAVRDARVLKHLELALSETDTETSDVVVMTARIMQGTAAGYEQIFEEHLFTEYEQLLFTHVVGLSERCGKPLKLLVVPSNNPVSAIVNVAIRLGCSRVYLGASEKLSMSTQARLVGEGWEEIDDPDKTQFELAVVPERGRVQRVQIGAHVPELAPEDIELTHEIWLEITEEMPESDLHHRDVVSFALRRFRDQMRGPDGARLRDEFLKTVSKERTRKASRRTGF
jgi:amino acid transporter